MIWVWSRCDLIRSDLIWSNPRLAELRIVYISHFGSSQVAAFLMTASRRRALLRQGLVLTDICFLVEVGIKRLTASASAGMFMGSSYEMYTCFHGLFRWHTMMMAASASVATFFTLSVVRAHTSCMQQSWYIISAHSLTILYWLSMSVSCYSLDVSKPT